MNGFKDAGILCYTLLPNFNHKAYIVILDVSYI